MTDDRSWYVVAEEPKEYAHTDVFGPFITEVDARSYAIDIANDNGWESIEPTLMTHAQAEELATTGVMWPYSHREPKPDDNDEQTKE